MFSLEDSYFEKVIFYPPPPPLTSFCYVNKVCSAINERKNQHMAWWMEALLNAEQNKDFSSELIRKIEEAITGNLNNSRSSRIPTG